MDKKPRVSKRTELLKDNTCFPLRVTDCEPRPAHKEIGTRQKSKTPRPQILPQMRLHAGFLGAGYAAVLVDLAVQHLRLPWTCNSGKRQLGKDAAGKMEKAE